MADEPWKGHWIKIRPKPELSKESKENVKPQQDKIAEAGKLVGERCKGKKKKEFYKCRHEVMVEVFGLEEKED